MIAGIGVDIAETARFEDLLARFGERFARRVLTEPERVEFERRRRSATYLATRFAAKEAVAKALGTGIGRDLSFQSVQVDNDDRGRPLLRFVAAGERLAAQRGIRNALLSLSDEKHYVVAMVVLEA